MKKTILLSFCALVLHLMNVSATDITGAISSSTTWTLAGSPYIVKNNVVVNPNVTLTIEPGVEVKFNANINIHVRGALIATDATFTANAGVTKGFWDGIYVSYESYEIGNVNLTNCTVEYAKNLYVRKGELTLSGCIVDNMSGTIRISKLGTLNIDNTSISNASFPITYYGEGTLNVGSNVTFSDNVYDYIDLDFSEITELLWLKDNGLPYHSDNTLNVRAAGTLKIDPGVNLHLVNSRINIFGKVKAVGTKAKPIIFDKTPSSNYWYGMKILASSVDSACVLKNCTFLNASYIYGTYTALEIDNASPTIDSCRFENNRYNLLVTGDSSPLISNSVLGKSIGTDNEVYNVSMDLNASPNFVNDSILFNATEIRAVALRGGTTVTNHNRLKKIDFIGLNNISYSLHELTTVHDTASLVIDPGVVIKSYNYNSAIRANGVLTGIGTVAEPIIFTHIADDTYGNPSDSQNNGTQNIGQSAGGRVMLYSQAESKLENWKFNYAGQNSSNWAIYIDNQNVVNNCEIRNSTNGIWFTKDAQLTNNNFVNVNKFPVGYNLTTGTPNLQGNTISNGYVGIQLDGVENVSPTLKKMDFAGVSNVPYVLSKNITIVAGNVLTINPGVVIKANEYWIGLIVNGALKAIGTKSEKIIFTSSKDDSAGGDTNNDGTSTVAGHDWAGLKFNGSASDVDNILKNVEIRYSYGYNNSSAVSITDCRVLMDSVKINFTNQCAIGIWGDANPEIKDCEFFNIGWEPLYMDMFANPTFSGNNKLANCNNIAIRLNSGTVNGTVPVRSFAGYNPITYLWMDNPLTVTEELTIPAGLTFKGHGRWNIQGKLNIEGTAQNPVVFTTLEDDSYGNPKDTQSNGVGSILNNGNYFVFYDAADDLSSIDHAIFRHSYQIPIQLNNASPLIKNSTFENFPREAISLVGTSAPAIDNNVFDNVKYPFNTSMLTYPRSTSGNIISGSTGRGIRIRDETLTQDVTLIKRDFAGIQNIPYVFRNYTVGSAAKLTIEPGIIAKFEDYGYINVQNGLIALGGSTPDSTIVFTSVNDDFYGGDTFNDGAAIAPWNFSWQGIYFHNESIDENCKLKNCIIKFASYPDNRGAVTIDNASPSITHSRFENGYHGIISINTSMPEISDCDFIGNDNNGYAVWNKNASNTITVSNSWFNAVTGPRHSSNPTGTGGKVSDYVAFTPVNTEVGKAELGDVSLNGSLNPYDASLILQHAVSNITLNQAQQKVADVSRNGTINSFDASLILQYNVGLIYSFGPSINLAPQKTAAMGSATSVSFASLQASTADNEFVVPLSISTAEGVKSLDMKFDFNPAHIKLLDITTTNISEDILLAQSDQTENGELSISMTSAYDLSLENGQVYLRYKIIDPTIESSEANINSVVANESSISIAEPTVTVSSRIITDLKSTLANNQLHAWISNNTLVVQFNNELQFKNANIKLFDISSRVLLNRDYNKSISLEPQIQIPLSDLGNPQKGVYLIQFTVDGMSYSKKLVIDK